MSKRETTRNLAVFALVGFGLTSAACEGGQTGDGPPKPGEGDDGCEETKLDIELDDDSALGFAPRRLVELASGAPAAPLHWREADPEFPYGPEDGVGSVTFEVLDVMQARYVDSEPSKSDHDIAVECNDSLEVDVVLGVRSEGGALDETLTVTLEAADPNVVGLSESLDPAALGGTFAFDEGVTDGGTMTLRLFAGFTEYGASGSLDALFETRDGNHASASMWSIATWPTAELCGGNPTVPFDAGEASAEAALDLVGGATGLVLVTADGQRLAVEIGAMSDGSPVCVATAHDAPNRPSGSLFTPVVLSLVTEDGTIEHDFEGTLTAVPATDGSLSEARVDAFCTGSSADEFSTSCGDWGIETAGYDYFNLRASLSFRPPADAPEVDGTFTINGTTPPPPCYDSSGGDDGSDCDDDGIVVELAVIHLERE